MYNNYKTQIEEVRNSNLSEAVKMHVFTLYTRDIDDDIYDLMFTEEEKKELMFQLHSYMNELCID